MEAEADTKVVAARTRDPDPPPPGNVVDFVGPRRRVGRYELLQRLGHGGMATVFLSRASGTAGFEKLMAVKVIHPHLASEPEFVEMFLDEARIAARIHHPHVVEILDLGREEGVFFMVMEYVEGETLASLLRQLNKADERLPLAVALQIVADACGGLAAAHDLVDRDGTPFKLVHRDVSPHNLLVAMSGVVKVVDFGIMKAAGKRSSTLTGQLRGKLPYMSPEQARSETLDHRTDLFALGAVLWELLTGERLFGGRTESEVLMRVADCEVPDIATKRSDLPAAVGAVLRRALAADREERYGSAQEMLRDLRAIMRQVDDGEDPRDVLAATMKRHFGGRIEYLHAAVRESGSSAELLARVDMRDSIDDRTPLATPSTPPLSRAVATPEGGATLTTTLAGAPARHWSLWVVLPLLGAAIGTAAVSLRDREADQVAEATPVEPAPARDGSTGEVPVATTVKWFFDTDPKGATLFVNGKRHDKTTPTAIEVPQGDEPVLVRFEKDGFVALERRLAPISSQNHHYPLVRAEADAPPPTPVNTNLHFTARKKGSGKPGKPTAPGPDASAPPPTKPDSQDERKLADMPDFGGGPGSHAPSGSGK
jgi:serine/threonine-protein kinase